MNSRGLFNTSPIETRIVGNTYASDNDEGFKADVKSTFESYLSGGVDLINSFGQIIGSPMNRQELIGTLTESFQNDAFFTDPDLTNNTFYCNYADRLQQITENSLTQVAQEAVMQGYAPIVAYNPFFLKKQWVGCVMKDVLMTEVPTVPVINLAFERRYIKDSDGNRYEMPDVFYNSELMKKLMDAARGITFDSDAAHELPLKNVDVLTEEYIPGIVVPNDRSEMLTQELFISEVTMDGTNWIPTNIDALAQTHQWANNKIELGTDDDGNVIFDELIGNVDYLQGTVTIVSKFDKITAVKLKGRLANRFNERSLDVERQVTSKEFKMPESGPRMNSAVTVEEAADAFALQKIDMIADNVDMMGRTLAEFEDCEIRTFLFDSFDRMKKYPVALYDQNSTLVESTFDLLPYEQYSRNITDWTAQSREYFERVINQLKQKLKTPEEVVVAIAHPTLIRFLQDGINWKFTDETQISGMKIAYNFGIYTSAADRVHIITSHYFDPADGIMFVVLPMTPEIITYKHYKYDMVIDRNYRNPNHTLVPNIMATHRTLTFEVTPIQGRLYIKRYGDLESPTTLVR